MTWWEYLLIGLGALVGLYLLYFLVVLVAVTILGKKVLKNFKDFE
jgi:apolipoprotein N-acyltransferase